MVAKPPLNPIAIQNYSFYLSFMILDSRNVKIEVNAVTATIEKDLMS